MQKTEQLQIRVTTTQKAAIRRRADAAGQDVSKWVLRKLLPPAQETFQDLIRNLANGANRSSSLAALHDFLAACESPELTLATELAPAAGLDAFEANYVAAMVEHARARRNLAPPSWVSAIEPLAEPWFASRLTSLRLHLLTRAPPAFRRRNLFVDSTIGDRV